jgi:DNA mismatch repair protein MutS2
MLLDARREVEEAIMEVRSARETLHGEGETLDEVDRQARRRVEEAARRLRQDQPERPKGVQKDRLEPGDRVSLSGAGSKGTVVEVRDDRAVVETAGLRLQLPLSELNYVGPPLPPPGKKAPAQASAASSWQGPEATPETEVDFRGLRVSEVGIEVDRALDQAVLGGLGELRIIHGKGTGALRETIGEILEKDGRVSGFRMGGPGEGGAGVTVVRLR